ncbi:hypothetical protein A2U01_0039633, partial [Trifolium medium]|nr:hypothetical protein [Trifolium medium]
MFSLGWGDGGEAWDQSPDLWQWQPDPACGYSVRGAYQILTTQQLAPLDVVEDLIWHKQASSLQSPSLALPDVEAWNQPSTYLSPAAPLALFG